MSTDLMITVGVLGAVGLALGQMVQKLKELKPIPVKVEKDKPQKRRK